MFSVFPIHSSDQEFPKLRAQNQKFLAATALVKWHYKMFPKKEPTGYVLDKIYAAHRKSTPSLPELDPFTIAVQIRSYIADEREATALERAKLGGQGLEGENKTGRAV